MADQQGSPEIDQLWERFHSVVNMTSRELADWIGVVPDISPGPQEPPPLGEAVVSILGKRRTDLTSNDVEVMRRVVDIYDEETAGVPADQLAGNERRRHRLRNIGHDVLREG
ncbi:MAG: DUF3140 domain-containing protein [bacterium]